MSRHGESLSPGPAHSFAHRRRPVCLPMLVLAAGACGLPADGNTRGELRGSVIEAPISKPELVLTDTEGQPYDLRAETEGFVTLLFFGYTSCPDVCPVHMGTLGAAFRELLPEVRNRVKVVFVSIDSDRDDEARLRDWLAGFHPSFVGLRGSLVDINDALAAMMMPAALISLAEDGTEPVVAHPAAVVAFGIDEMARVQYPFGVRRADWTHDLPMLVEGL